MKKMLTAILFFGIVSQIFAAEQTCPSGGYFKFTGTVATIFQKGTNQGFALLKNATDNSQVWVNFSTTTKEFLSEFLAQKVAGTSTTVYYIKGATCPDVPWETTVCNDLQFLRVE